jgi:hypothetical protein
VRFQPSNVGTPWVRKWNALPPDERAAVQEQGRRAVTAIMAVKVAATAERSANDPPPSWEAALEKVSNPGPAEEMAKAVVSYLQTVSEAKADEIANNVGAAGKDDSSFKRAMAIARDDGYIKRVGVTFHGIKWDTTEWADRELLDTPHVRKVEEKIVDALSGRFGLASLDHIAGALGLDNDAPELRAALERAISDEEILWYCNGIYGLSLDRLGGFEPERDIWAETKPVTEDKDLGHALKELEASVKGLAAAMNVNGPEGPSPSVQAAGQSAPSTSDEDPYEGLRQIQALRDAGILTEDEFQAKKGELLNRI